MEATGQTRSLSEYVVPLVRPIDLSCGLFWCPKLDAAMGIHKGTHIMAEFKGKPRQTRLPISSL